MQTTASLAVRRMDRGDLDTALDWAAAEGWNPGLFDAEPFFAADPQGFFLAEVDGRPVGSFSAVAYDDDFGFTGLFIVRPEYRGGRCGVVLGEAGLEHLGSRTVGLDGVLAKQENYQRLGFEFAYRTLRYEGVGRNSLPRVAESPAILANLRSVPLDELSQYDARAFPAPRPQFLKAWIRQPGTTGLAVLQLGRLAGYGVARPCRIGYKIGPLVADDQCLAEVLFEGLLAGLPGATFYLDVPDPNAAAMSLAHRHGMKPVFETARMYRGPAPAIDLDRLYGVTTLELG